MGSIGQAVEIAKKWTKNNFSKTAVVALERPVEGRWVAWEEDQWLRLSLAHRMKLQPKSVWRNGKLAEGLDPYTLQKR